MTKFEKIRNFSRELETALNINIIDHTDVGAEEVQWHSPNYIVYLICRCQGKHWRNILEVCPKPKNYVKRDFVYYWNLNLHEEPLSNNKQWYYYFQGTCTKNLPSKAMRNDIIRDIIHNEIIMVRNGDTPVAYRCVDNGEVIPISSGIVSRFDICLLYTSPSPRD